MDLTNYRNPQYVYAWLGILGVLIIFLSIYIIVRRLRRIESGDSDYRAYGGMWMMQELGAYKAAKIAHVVCAAAGACGLVISLVSAGLMFARPYHTEEDDQGLRRRDIFICMDISTSLYNINYDFVQHLEDVVDGLDGDRIGISMFNTTSVLYMPLTDDKAFAREKLEKLGDYLLMQKDFMENCYMDDKWLDMSDEELQKYEDMLTELNAFDSGTTIGFEEDGSSLIGEGLATALFDFPSLDDSERTRAIILVTDNCQAELGKPVVELDEASRLCMQNKVTLFTLSPSESNFDIMGEGYDFDDCTDGLRTAADVTGGESYLVEDDFDTSGIIKAIQQHEAIKVSEIIVRKTIDDPQIMWPWCMAGIVILGLAMAGEAVIR